jgi:hypothetical protein
MDLALPIELLSFETPGFITRRRRSRCARMR